MDPARCDGLCQSVTGIRDALAAATLKQNQAIGVLIGTMVGDVLGAAVEGASREAILKSYPQGLTEFQPTQRTEGGPGSPQAVGMYTDDFQMTLALAESLVEKGACDAADAAAKYCDAFQPWRGYGRAAEQILQGLKSGALRPETSGTALYPTGSFANGGAMRIAPVGFCYRNAPDAALYKAVENALLCTHVHPEGVDGAFIQASAVAMLAEGPEELRAGGESAATSSADLLRSLQARARTDAMKTKLGMLVAMLEEFNGNGRPSQYDHHRVLEGVSEDFQIKAVDAVSCALWMLCVHWEEPRKAVQEAVHLGGDTDTIAAMTGALCGALHGADWIPDSWWQALENGEKGRDRALEVAMRMADLDVLTTRAD